MKKIIFCILILQSIVFAEDIKTIINKSLNENPKLKAIEKELKSYKAKEIFVSNLEDPVVSFSINDIQIFYKPLSRTLEPMQTVNFSFSQKIPWLKKLKTKKDKIKKLYDERFYYLQDLKQDIIFNIYRISYRYWEVKEKLKIIKEYEKVAKHLIDFSNTLYSVGKVSQSEVFNAQVFYSQLKEKEVRLIERQKSLLSNLYYYTNFNIKDIKINLIKPYYLTGLNNYISLALEQNPKLKSYKQKIKAKKEELKLAKLDYKPDFRFFTTYSYREHFRDYISFGVSFNLPVWKKYRQDKKVIETSLLLNKEKDMYKDLENKIKSQIEESFYNANSFYESYKIFKDYLLTQTKSVYESVIDEYKVGTKNIFDVIKALNQILNVKMKLIEITANFNISYKNIEKLTGEIK
ncbi:TolC family protein [Hydrogenothermus marinus]|uniref:Outer membrane protein TolC n=1 Tax=Hydrogenothermus marinus TaxID=133270 RepID=A0A3M0BMQ0_9AQUI|nr:TolC family protein [Hydrogenothermus marinus]RMA97754.1 outer membrane protein TolC [Hydrogenothermus marinus]